MISRTRIRSFIAAVFAIAVVVCFAAVVTTSQGMDIPILNNIGRMLGFGG